MKNSNFCVDHSSEDRWQAQWKIPQGFGGVTGGSKLWLCARGHGSAAYKARRSSWIHPFEAELAGVLQDELAVACVVAIELKAGLVCDQRLKKRLALDEPKLRNIPSAKMENIEA